MHLRTRHAAVVLAVLLAVPAVGLAAKVKAPNDLYKGKTAEKQPVSLQASRSSISIFALTFVCRGTVTGNTSAQEIKLRKTKRGYAFAIKTYGIVTYSDERGDDNAAITLAGRFSTTAKSVRGTFRVKTTRCGSSGSVKWHARR
jgi:hypothetical protein